ncbi:circadian clock protein KaiC [Rufibacter sp. DG15C]|uniref:circadian clock protein KaiC n=1 Tax=Rufibacter sp. DG15C TaxID=1379909 RepID=UPI00078DA502|nr:circadian clock protein KaiC [Rufibacter sp. DG15C]AMM51930.1 circadian clock protein KaiC [Rufibacter sp. DG15C]
MILKKLITGIAAFDHISEGGLPLGRTTLVTGSTGSAKTLFGAQFLAMGIMEFDQPGVFVTFEEHPDDIRSNLRSFNWDIDAWEKAGKWVFVDASPKEEDTIAVGEFNLNAFRVRLEHAIAKTKAKRVVIDSIGSVFLQFPEETFTIRRELSKIVMALRRLQVTSIITAERTEEYGKISRYGVEEFLTDNVIILRNVLSNEKRRRTIEILKFRGSNHVKGESPFTLTPERAVVIVPLSAMRLDHKSSNKRIPSGVPALDEMCGGGFFRDSLILISGATGAGKTLMVSSFINGMEDEKETGLIMAFEESREQLFRNSKAWGQDLEKLEKDGRLKVVCIYPEVASLEEHLVHIQELVKELKPSRIAIDSISALTRNPSDSGFQEFITALTAFLKHEEITCLFTATTPMLTGGTSVTEGSIATITDTIILLRYVEKPGNMLRCLSVLKMRGTNHDSSIRRYSIDGAGIRIGEPLEILSGILSGNPVVISQNE